MEELITNYLTTFPTLLLLVIIGLTLFTLAKGADILVDEAVNLSLIWGVPKVIIGATIVSLGTTLPEVAVSVLAALRGNPDLALGNAIGSIIVDTALILGLAAIIGSLPIDKNVINRQGRIQLFAGILLAIVCLPFLSTSGTGNVSQFTGFIFLVLLGIYIYTSIRWAKKANENSDEFELHNTPIYIQLLKMTFGIAIVIISSKILIPSVEITALRIGIPQSIIAATLVAFGTSLPELVTAISAVRKHHGDLAVGNIIGADILNVLFVTGAAAAATPNGLDVPIHFYKLHLPTMIIVLLVFRFFATRKNHVITKKQGLVLSGLYLIYLVLNFYVM